MAQLIELKSIFFIEAFRDDQGIIEIIMEVKIVPLMDNPTIFSRQSQ